MARRQSSNSASARGFGDIIGVSLLALALLLLVAQMSFDRNDISSNRVATAAAHTTHNWVGPLGAWLAYGTFFVFGFAGYMLPLFLALFGLAYLFDVLAYLKRRWIWAVVLLVSCMGWLHLMDLPHVNDKLSLISKARYAISAPSIGGLVGLTLYRSFFWMLGSVGAGITYGALDLISLLFLTNFQLGPWMRAFVG